MLWVNGRGDAVKSTPAKTSPPVASRALEWVWQHLRDVPRPHALDCGPVQPATVNVLLRRGAKLYVVDLISPLLEGAPAFWDRSQKRPLFLIDDFLAQVPHIPPASLSVAFCWHLLDLFPREALRPLVEGVMSFLEPGGVLFCMLREPYLAVGADVTWHLEGMAGLRMVGEGRASFPAPALTNREMERLVPGSTVRTFLTRSGRREVLVVKQQASE